MQERRWWQRICQWQQVCQYILSSAGVAAIAACGADTSSITTTSPTATSTQAVRASDNTARSPGGTNVSLIYQDNPQAITVEDISLILVAAYLPGNRTSDILGPAAGSLLGAPDSIPSDSLNPIPIGPNVNFAEVTGEPEGLITLEDAAVVQAAFLRAPTDRTASNLAADAGRLLDLVGISVRAIPGAALPPITEEILAPNSSPVNGSLDDNDADNPNPVGSKRDDFILETPRNGDVIRVELRSNDFDALIQLVDLDTGAVLGEDDDSGPNDDAQLVFIPESDRNYVIRATSSDGTIGNYTLSAFAVDAPLLAVPPARTTGSLDSTDEVFETAAFADYFRLPIFDTEQLLQIDLTSTSGTAFDPVVQVLDSTTGAIISSDDNGGTGNDARLIFVASPGIIYLVRATSAGPQQTGSYALTTAATEAPNTHDITQVSSSIFADTLSFTVEFAEEIAPPSSESSNAVFGRLSFDTDQTTATGIEDDSGLLGVESFIELASEADFLDGTVELVDREALTTLARVPITFTPNSFRVDIPLGDLEDEGNVNYRLLVLNALQPTDTYPNTGVGRSPEFASDPTGDTLRFSNPAAATRARVRLMRVDSPTVPDIE
ncbi:MAG: hypothetical protein AAFY57_07740 [Cyanobacteria bacterium J06642_2]